MSSLLAILLVIKSDAGERFVFRYPAYPRRREKVKARSQTVPHEHHSPGGGDWHHPNPTGSVYGVYGYSAPESFNDPNLRQSVQRRKESGGTGASGGGLDTSTVVGNGLGSHNSSNESTPQDRWNYDPLLGFQANFLASILSPRTSMCDKKFQLTIDDITFVGHPTSLTGEDFERRKSLVVLPQSEESRYPDNDSEYMHEESDSPDVGSRSPRPRRQQTDRHGERDEHLHPNDSSDFSKRRSPKSSTSPRSSQMTQFHLVFVLAPSDLELNHEVEAIYKHVAIKFTAALRYEQLRCEYVRKETEKIIHLTDEMNKRREEFKKKDEANKNGTSSENPDDIMDQILSISSLARDIKHVYHSIANDTVAHIVLNDFIDLSLQIPTFGSGPYPLYAFQETDYYSMIPDLMRASRGHEYEAYPALCPYHALLLLQDPEEVLRDMPLDSSPTLVQLVQVLTPKLSMQDLSLLLDCSLAQVYRFAAHLLYWRKAKLIHSLTVQNIYIISPQANLNDFSTLTEDFEKHVPGLKLPPLLAALSTPRPFSSIIPSKEQRNQYLEAITYLLRKDFVIQLHQFLVLMVPRHVKNPQPPGSMDEMAEQEEEEEEEEEEEGEQEQKQGEQKQKQGEQEQKQAKRPSRLYEMSEATAVISGPGQATEAERDWISEFAEDKGGPKEVTKLFERLVHYFNGKHHVEEILWREGISRKHLRMVTNWFRNELVSVYHY